MARRGPAILLLAWLATACATAPSVTPTPQRAYPNVRAVQVDVARAYGAILGLGADAEVRLARGDLPIGAVVDLEGRPVAPSCGGPLPVASARVPDPPRVFATIDDATLLRLIAPEAEPRENARVYMAAGGSRVERVADPDAVPENCRVILARDDRARLIAGYVSFNATMVYGGPADFAVTPGADGSTTADDARWRAGDAAVFVADRDPFERYFEINAAGPDAARRLVAGLDALAPAAPAPSTAVAAPPPPQPRGRAELVAAFDRDVCPLVEARVAAVSFGRRDIPQLPRAEIAALMGAAGFSASPETLVDAIRATRSADQVACVQFLGA